ncbi:MAG: TonB family protein [Hyphomicrobium sp.]|jgi:protein TonB|nr:TonB family protein [Hyphomicrobium sp.]
MFLRTVTWLVSLGAHAAFAVWMFAVPGGASLHSGEGDDQVFVEQSIAIEGLDMWGQDDATVQAVEAEPLEASQARPAVEEVKEMEKVEETTVVSSETGPEQEVEQVKPEPEKQPTPPQVATLAQEAQVAVEERRAASAAQSGGDVTSHSMYLGKLRSHLEKKKINPRTRQVGTAVVRFTVDAAGQLLTREIALSSGNKQLDDAAIASVEKAAPFPAMPDDIDKGPLVVSVPFRFTVR